MNRKYYVAAVAMLMLIILACGGVSEEAGELVRIRQYAPAYLDPVEEAAYKAGYFAEAGIVRIEERLDDWLRVEYDYDPSMYESKGIRAEEAASGEQGVRTVYVRRKSVLDDTVDGAGISRNILLTDEQLQEQAGVREFDPALLTDTGYVSAMKATAVMKAEAGKRVRVAGSDSDFRDALTAQTSAPYKHDNRINYTPEIIVNGILQYPMSDAVYAFLKSDEDVFYGSENGLISDARVLAGLKQILENSPPYKVYTSYPADYEEASRTAAALAIRAYLKATEKTGDYIDIYSSIEAYDASSFNRDYFEYMYWLYEKAMEAYSNYDSTQTVYLSCDVEEAPVEKDGHFVATVRITTNAESGWKIDRASLPEEIVRIENATFDGEMYVGQTGTTLLTVIAGANALDKTLSIPVQYNSDEPIVQFLLPENEEYPALVSLTGQSSTLPAKQVALAYPESVPVRVYIADENGQPLPDVTVMFSSPEGHYYTSVTDENGTGEITVVPGKYKYTFDSIPDGYSGLESGELQCEQTAELRLVAKSQTYTLHVRSVNDLTNEVIADRMKVSLIRQDESAAAETKDLANGETSFENLTPGEYIIRLGGEYKGFEKTEDKIVRISGKDVTEELRNHPVSGYIEVVCKENRTGNPVAGAKVEVLRGSEVINTLVTSEEGKTEKIRLPVEAYTVRLVTTPDGYELNDKKGSERVVKLRYQKSESPVFAFQRNALTLNIVLRENPEDKNAENSGECSFEGAVYQLAAAEDIQGETSRILGSTVVATTPEMGRDGKASMDVSLPGKYILREIQPGTGYRQNREQVIEITEAEQTVTVRKEPITGRLSFARKNEQNEPVGGIEYYMYPARYTSHAFVPNKLKYTLVSDENGLVEMTVPYGEWKIVQPKKKTPQLKEAILFSVREDNVPLRIVYIGDHMQPVVTIRTVSTEDKLITRSSSYELYRDGSPVQDPVTGNSLLVTIEGEGIVPCDLAGGEYTLKQTGVPDGFVQAEDISFEVSDQNITVEVVNEPRKKNVSVTASIPSWTDGVTTEKDENGITVQRPGSVNVSNVHVTLIGTNLGNPVKVITSSQYSEITPPVENKPYCIIPSNLPAGYHSEPAFRFINPAETEDSVIPVQINLVPDTGGIFVKLHETASGVKNGAIYGLYRQKPVVGPEGETASKTAPIASKRAMGGYVLFIGAFQEGTYYVARMTGDTPDTENATEAVLSKEGELCYAKEASDNRHPVRIGAKDRETGEPLKNTYIRIEDGNGTVYEGYTDGTEPIADLKTGTYSYEILLVTEEYALPKETYHFTVGENGDITGDTDALLDKNIVQIQITDNDGLPVQGSEWIMRNTDAAVSQKAISNANGLVTFGRMPFGMYEIREILPATGYSGANTIVRVEVDGAFVNSEAPVARIDAEKNRIGFTVKAADGTAIPNVGLTLKDSEGSIVQNAWSDEKGQVSFDGVPYGSYMIRAESIPDAYLAPPKSIHITAGTAGVKAQNGEQTIRLVSRARKYRLVKEAGRGVEGAEFMIVNTATQEVLETVRTDAEGRFEVKADDYGVFNLIENYTPEGAARVPDRTFEVRENWDKADEQVIKTVSDCYEILSVTNKGEPLPGASFAISNPATGEKRLFTADENGLVKFTGLTVGDYVISQESAPDGYAMSNETLPLHIDENYTQTTVPYRFTTFSN